MSSTVNFTLGGMEFEADVCTDPSSGDVNAWVYRTDVSPRELVATGEPDALNLKPAYAKWDDRIAILEQAVMDNLEDVSA